MNKERFKNEQPVVYRTLSNALKNDRLSHAYLLIGPKGSMKNEVGLLLAQSIVCTHRDEDGFACQECDDCRNMAHNNHPEFLWVDKDHTVLGYKEREKEEKKKSSNTIKRKVIEEVQRNFETTRDRKIYFFEQFNRATTAASNVLLKFLEEPQPGIYAILSTDERSNVLPTIQSRCQWIVFRPASVRHNEEALMEITDEDSARMLAHSGYTLEQAQKQLESEDFVFIQEQALHYVEHWESMDAVFTMQKEVFAAKTPRMNKDNISLWLAWVIYYNRKNIRHLSLGKQVAVHQILIEARDLLPRPVELALFLDKIYNQIRKVVIS